MASSPQPSESEQTLSDLKRNALFPFAGYRSDTKQYMLLEMFFTYLFKSVIAENANGDWQAWFPPAKEQDGNPIFSAINLYARRGVRVIQHPDFPLKGTPDEPRYFPIQPFLSHSPAEPFSPDTTVLELCMVADPSSESEKWCRQFWGKFCLEKLSEEDMDREIRRYEDEIGMNAGTELDKETH
jgi:hypothetical protein